MTEPIDKDEFNDVKELASAFKAEILYDDLHREDADVNPLIADLDPNDDTDIDNMNDSNISSQSLDEILEQDNNILLACNIYTVHNDKNTATYICYRSDFHGSPNPLNVIQLARMMTSLAKLGRKGIAQLAAKNADKRDKVCDIENSMNLK